MNPRRTRLIFLLAWLLALAPDPARAAPTPNPWPGVASGYLLQVNGETRWGAELHRPFPPASLTKVMSALLILERCRPEAVVTVSAAAAAETGTRLGLKAGEKFRGQELLAAMLLNSANDACLALAEAVAGSEEAFVALMNQRAEGLQLTATHFTNACGHDHPQHYSSTADLAQLAALAGQNPLFARLAATRELRIATRNGRRSFLLKNANALLGRYPGAIGLKTGYTPQAGKCLIALAERDGVRVLLVMLNAPNRWWDATTLLDHAFRQARHDS